MGESSKAEFWTSSSSNYNLFNQSSDLSGIKRDIPYLVACYATLHPLCRSVGQLVRRSIGPSIRWSVCWSIRQTLLFFVFCGLWPHCTCPKDEVTSINAPAHPHATEVAMYPALFHFELECSLSLFYLRDS